MQLVEHQFKVMGGPAELHLWAATAAMALSVAQAAEQEARRLERKYSRFLPDSLLSQINAAAGQGCVAVDDETAALLDYAQVCVQQSEGLFDPTCGVLRRVWDFKTGRLPSPSQLKPILARIGWHKVQWQRPYFGLSLAGMELDLGGVVKEYAADRLAALCRERGINHGIVNLAGDLALIGPQPDARPWLLGIRHPRQPESAIAHISAMQGGLATSGDYERFLIHKGQRYCHILNPKTGYPAQALASVSVLAPQCLIAGSATTMALLMTKTKALAFLRDLGLPWLAIDAQLRVYGSDLPRG